MQVTPLCLMLSCLQVSPDRSQFFRYDSVSLSCLHQVNSTWKVKRRTPEGGVRLCSSGWGLASSGSGCIIGNTYPSDSGVYWCESADGNRSSSVNITITDRTVLLESPALPVAVGAAMTLGCRAETFSSNHTYEFFKDGRLIGSSSSGQMVIHSTSKSDEGLYVCSIPGSGESISSWLTVDGSLPASSSDASAASCWVSVSRLMCHLVVGTPYLLSTALLLIIYRNRNKAAQTVAEAPGSNSVIMETVV